MQRKEIEKKYIEKINQLRKYNKAYFSKDNPIVSDAEYDDLKKQILSFEKKYVYLKNKDSPSKKIGYEPLNKFKKIKSLFE